MNIRTSMARRPCRHRVWLALLLGVVAVACAPTPDRSGQLDEYRARLRDLGRGTLFETTRILDRRGHLLAEVAPQGRRTWVPLSAIAPALPAAVVATEDRTFYSNTGVDTGAVARAVLQNVEAGDTVSGASTITMQLVRLVAFPPAERFAQTLDRKVREAHLAAEIAERHSKDAILEAYLNTVYFGHGAYGAEAAAQTYFGRHAADLTWAQATLLAGVLQAPALLDPLHAPEQARARQAIVLASLVATGTLTAEQATAVGQAGWDLVAPPPVAPRRAPYFVDYVTGLLPSLVDPSLAARGGLTITTTLDLPYTEWLADLAARQVAALRAAHDLGDAAIVAVEPGTGEILAMVGGANYDDPAGGQVNVAVEPRQMGSAFKPLTYATALEAGHTPGRILWDIPLSFPQGDSGTYQPHNYDGQYRGPVRLRQALANSLNAAAVQLLAEVGVEQVHALAMAMELPLDPDPWRYGLSLTLGGAEVPLLQLTAAYAALPAGGRYVAPAAVRRVERAADGAVVFAHVPRPRQVMSPQTAWLLTDILSDVEARRPAFAPQGPLTTAQPTAVKTGTTDDFRDNLTIGYTPYLAVGVWAGNKDGHPMRDVLGITGAAPIWHEAMELLFGDESLLLDLGHGTLPATTFVAPEGIERGQLCDVAALVAGGDCRARAEVFAAGTPTTDMAVTVDRFSVVASPARGGGSSGETCVVPDRSGGRLMLLPPQRPDLAEQVREWARGNGWPVAPPRCDLSAQLGPLGGSG